jgi:Leucine Rich repeat
VLSSSANSEITHAGIFGIAEALKTNTSLQELVLTGGLSFAFVPPGSHPLFSFPLLNGEPATSLKHPGMAYLASALEVNSTLRSLDVASNEIGLEGFRCLAASLAMNDGLKSLILSYNRLGVEAAQPLSAMIRANSCLVSLLLTSPFM